MPFMPNLDCIVTRQGTGFDIHGQPTMGEVVPARCSIIYLDVERRRTSVRADSSASRGKARERTAAARLLFLHNFEIGEGDFVEVAGAKLRVSSVFPRHNIAGQLDHYQIDAEIWESA